MRVRPTHNRYVLRATALHSMGMPDKSVSLLREALSRDPDNQEVSRALKRLKRLIADAARLREAYKAAMSARRFEEAISLCGEGLKLEPDDPKACAVLYSERAKAYKLLARSRARGERLRLRLRLCRCWQAAGTVARERRDARPEGGPHPDDPNPHPHPHPTSPRRGAPRE